MPDRLLSAREVWEALGIRKTAFYAIAFFRTRKVFPSAGGGAVRYRESDVQKYLTLRTTKAA